MNVDTVVVLALLLICGSGAAVITVNALQNLIAQVVRLNSLVEQVLSRLASTVAASEVQGQADALASANTKLENALTPPTS